MSTIRIPIHTHKYTLAAYAPMYRVSIDTINLDEADIYGNKYIIVIIDCFSRWIELYAVPDLTAVSAAQAIIQWCGTFGVPNEIHSDLGTQYVNQIVGEMEQLMGFTHTFNISPHSKEENGLVERANKEVMRHLRSYIFDKNIISDWSINLPFVKRIVNSSRHESIGCSPADIIFGKSINLDWNIILPREDRTVDLTTSEYMDKKLKVQDAITAQAARIQKERDDIHMQLQNTSLTEFRSGSYVLLRYPDTQQRPGPPSKLMTNIRGPMKVVRALRQGNYILEDLTTGKETRAHISRMVPFYYDDRFIDPRQVANKDRQLSDLETVLKHDGDRTNPRSLRFQVRWQKLNGVRPRDTWEDFSVVKNAAVVHEYLIKHKMKSLIPAVYRKDYV